jgi:uncharacterized protein YlzI (FlbEa/FlbD family)
MATKLIEFDQGSRKIMINPAFITVVEALPTTPDMTFIQLQSGAEYMVIGTYEETKAKLK